MRKKGFPGLRSRLKKGVNPHFIKKGHVIGEKTEEKKSVQRGRGKRIPFSWDGKRYAPNDAKDGWKGLGKRKTS